MMAGKNPMMGKNTKGKYLYIIKKLLKMLDIRDVNRICSLSPWGYWNGKSSK
jgi:hypothetical protein